MPQNITIINSRKDISSLFEYLEELNTRGYWFRIWSADEKISAKFKSKNWPAKKYRPLFNINNLFFSLVFIFLYPLFFVFYFIILLWQKFKHKTASLILINWPEKIFFTLPGKILGLKIFWLECPDTDWLAINKILKKLYVLYSHWAQIITMTRASKENLEKLGVKPEKIAKIQPGIRLNHFNRQENIFTKLAHIDHEHSGRKFFTIGTVSELKTSQNMEILFRAVKNCLSVIPDMQLIIIGGGVDRKNLSWLAKKIEIENIIWFVGEQANLKKWLENFDVFIFTDQLLNLNVMSVMLQALAAGVPIIAPAGPGLEDLIFDNKTGLLLDNYDSEILAQTIIKLKQNRRLRLLLGENGRDVTNSYFSINKPVEQLLAVLN